MTWMIHLNYVENNNVEKTEIEGKIQHLLLNNSVKDLLKCFINLKNHIKILMRDKKVYSSLFVCVTAVDNIGQVVNAIDNSKFKDNTIIVFVSDHGWTMGEKNHVYKNSLWEESTRVPLTIRAPGLTKPNSKVNHPVS